MKSSPLVFIKLGGSFLGDKRKRRSFRRGAVQRVAQEIARVRRKHKRLRILIGHGGGGAAHFPARQYRTRQGVPGGGGWRGFVETRRGVMTMNRRVLDSLSRAGLQPILVSPVAGVIAHKGSIRHWDTRVIQAVLASGQIPLIHGDVVLDRALGFTICSTEELFAFLVPRLRPQHIVLATDVEGVYLDPSEAPRGVATRQGRRGVRVVHTVNRKNVAAITKRLSRSVPPRHRTPVRDVTGGMRAKLEHLVAMVRTRSDLEAQIVSGLVPGAVEAALLNAAGVAAGDTAVGTTVRWS